MTSATSKITLRNEKEKKEKEAGHAFIYPVNEVQTTALNCHSIL